ncbi:hypothetical protein [Polynucleobacter necessarius]|uniref:hypothetical protein n=1 Tax=Polynucleobacter necessarius TaxID=576610 RepID=UPI000E092F54|nr:hypothetical protein [Polynucleobacter necessarius]
MTIIFLLLSPALFALFWIVRFQICAARRRRLIYTYGIDSKKLRKLSCKEVTQLRKRIAVLDGKKDAYELEGLVKHYRP